jgi:hypothetical protein
MPRVFPAVPRGVATGVRLGFLALAGQGHSPSGISPILRLLRLPRLTHTHQPKTDVVVTVTRLVVIAIRRAQVVGIVVAPRPAPQPAGESPAATFRPAPQGPPEIHEIRKLRLAAKERIEPKEWGAAFHRGRAVAAASWTAPVPWRFGRPDRVQMPPPIARPRPPKRQRTAAVQNLADFATRRVELRGGCFCVLCVLWRQFHFAVQV